MFPTPPSTEAIEKLRQRFNEEVSKNRDSYHQIDIERVQKEEWQVKRFLLQYSNKDEAFDAMVKALQWKKDFGIHERTDQYFPKEFWELSGVEVSGQNYDKEYVQWEVFRTQRTFKELKQLIYQFVAHMLERVDYMAGELGFVMLMDINGAGLSNIDIDLIKFKLNIIEYYPCSLRHLWVVDLPQILSPVMTMILSLMNPKLRQMVMYLKSKDLPKYLDVEQIPKSLNGKREKVSVPENLVPLAHMMDKLQLTDKFVDFFYKTHKMKKPKKI